MNANSGHPTSLIVDEQRCLSRIPHTHPVCVGLDRRKLRSELARRSRRKLAGRRRKLGWGRTKTTRLVEDSPHSFFYIILSVLVGALHVLSTPPVPRLSCPVRRRLEVFNDLSCLPLLLLLRHLRMPSVRILH